MFGLFGVVIALSTVSATAQSISGSVSLPCEDPTVTRLGVTPQGMCGYEFDVASPTRGHAFTLSPAKPAHLDIYFYASDDSVDAAYLCSTGSFSAVVPAHASYAIVVLSDVDVNVSSCPGAELNNAASVPFSYATS